MNQENLTLRQKKILHFMKNTRGFVTSGELARHFDVSSKTARNDIAGINRALSGTGISVYSENSKGFMMTEDSRKRLSLIGRASGAFLTKEDRCRFLSIRLCLADKPINLYDLEEEMYVSHTTLEHDIAELRQRFTERPPYIKLLQSGDYIHFAYDEKKIRLNKIAARWPTKAVAQFYFIEII